MSDAITYENDIEKFNVYCEGFLNIQSNTAIITGV
jgi:hypothetical protein